MKPDTQSQTPSSDIRFEVDQFRPEDASGVVQLFEAVYGRDYPIDLYYDPEKLVQANLTGEVRSVVARTPEGLIVGVHNLVRSANYDSNYEWAAGLVLPEYRAMRVTDKIVDYLFNVLTPKLGIGQIHGEAACIMVHIQKMCARLRMVETAIELALMPAALYSKEKNVSGRVATLLISRCNRSNPHTVFVPKVYEEEFRFLYSALDDERILAPAEENSPVVLTSKVSMQIFDFAQVARITINCAGQDLGARLAELEKEARGKNVVVVQAWVRSDSPAVASAVDTLRSRGYFLGGILPRWFDTDGLLMQKLWCNPDLPAIILYTDRARSILDIVARDWERSTRLG